MTIEIDFYESVFRAIVLSLVFGFLIILITTKNFLLTIIGFICISLTIFSVIAIFVDNEYRIGIYEALALIISMGLSANYIMILIGDYTQ